MNKAYNTFRLQEALTMSFNSETLIAFLYDAFPSVYARLTSSTEQREIIIRLLLSHVERERGFDQLLSRLRVYAPTISDKSSLDLILADIEYEYSTNITFELGSNVELTPYLLNKIVSPYLVALADVQHVIDDIHTRPPSKIHIFSIEKHSPLGITLAGVAEVGQLLVEYIIPWRKKHSEKMARLSELGTRLDIENKKVELAEKRIRGQADAQKAVAETEKLRAETERLRLENRKLELELRQTEIQLVLDILDKIGANLTEKEKIDYVTKLLPPLKTLVTTDLKIATVDGKSPSQLVEGRTPEQLEGKTNT